MTCTHEKNELIFSNKLLTFLVYINNVKTYSEIKSSERVNSTFLICLFCGLYSLLSFDLGRHLVELLAATSPDSITSFNRFVRCCFLPDLVQYTDITPRHAAGSEQGCITTHWFQILAYLRLIQILCTNLLL